MKNYLYFLALPRSGGVLAELDELGELGELDELDELGELD